MSGAIQKKMREPEESFTSEIFASESSDQICEEIGEEPERREVPFEEKTERREVLLEREQEAPRSKDGQERGDQVVHLRCHLKVNNVQLERAGDKRRSFDWRRTVYLQVVALGTWNFFEKWFQPKMVRMKT